MPEHANLPPAQWHGARLTAGALSARPTPHVAGQLYYATDTGRVYVANPDLTWHVLEARHNFSATAAPTASDDSNDGYSVGSLWFNTTAQTVHACLDATAANAVWVAVTATSSGTWGGVFIARDYVQSTSSSGDWNIPLGPLVYGDGTQGEILVGNIQIELYTGGRWLSAVNFNGYYFTGASDINYFILRIVRDVTGTPTTLASRRCLGGWGITSSNLHYDWMDTLTVAANDRLTLQAWLPIANTFSTAESATYRLTWALERLS